VESNVIASHREPSNKGKIVGQKAPFKVRDLRANGNFISVLAASTRADAGTQRVRVTLPTTVRATVGVNLAAGPGRALSAILGQLGRSRIADAPNLVRTALGDRHLDQ
jgi:hypothetical protein